MARQPEGTLERIDAFLTHPGAASTTAFFALVSELLDLVDTAGISTTRARAVLAIDVKPWPPDDGR
jgi:hypothetical protein